MKGQYLTVEYVIFFAIGVMVVVLVYGLFYDTNMIIEKDMTKKQLEAVGNMITGAIVNVFETSNQTNSTIYYNLSIPSRVSNCIYSVFVTAEKKLRLECTGDRDINAEIELYNFNINSNIIYSTRRFVGILSRINTVDLL